MCGQRRSARQDETAQRLDPVWSSRRSRFPSRATCASAIRSTGYPASASFSMSGRHRSAPRSNRSFWIIGKLRVHIARRMQPRQPDGGVGFIHRAIGCDAQRMFGHPAAVAKRGFARVAGPGVDLVQNDHRLVPPAAQIDEEQDQHDRNDCATIRQRMILLACLRLNSPPLPKPPMPINRMPSTTSTRQDTSQKSGSLRIVRPSSVLLACSRAGAERKPSGRAKSRHPAAAPAEYAVKIPSDRWAS